MTTDAAFYDAQCPQCKAKIGWHGRVLDRPACCRCGHRPTDESMNAAAKQIADFRQLLKELREASPGWDKWQRARVAAGLTLRQAAKLLEVAPTTLSEIEQGQNRPSEALAGRMIRCYSGDVIGGPTP